ncbi:MAG: hypothetical protein LBC42_04015 [Puniceicoccales bacterium]|jgi:DNA-binding XRE family transcriptional regulator|nr:hypothetical protein [Puniceicoccales bacterium]
MKSTIGTIGGSQAHQKSDEISFLTARQLAKRWGLCKQTILKISKEYQLPSVTFGNQIIRFPIGMIQEIERKIIGSKFPIMRAIREACSQEKTGDLKVEIL